MRRQRNLVHIARRWFAAPNRNGREYKWTANSRNEVTTLNRIINEQFTATCRFQGTFKDINISDTLVLQNKWKLLIFLNYDRVYGRYGDYTHKDFDSVVKKDFEPLGCEVAWPYYEEGTIWSDQGKFLASQNGFNLNFVYIVDPDNVCRWLDSHLRFPKDLDYVLEALKKCQSQYGKILD